MDSPAEAGSSAPLVRHPSKRSPRRQPCLCHHSRCPPVVAHDPPSVATRPTSTRPQGFAPPANPLRQTDVATSLRPMLPWASGSTLLPAPEGADWRHPMGPKTRGDSDPSRKRSRGQVPKHPAVERPSGTAEADRPRGSEEPRWRLPLPEGRGHGPEGQQLPKEQVATNPRVSESLPKQVIAWTVDDADCRPEGRWPSRPTADSLVPRPKPGRALIVPKHTENRRIKLAGRRSCPER